MTYSHQTGNTIYSVDAWPCILTALLLTAHLGALWALISYAPVDPGSIQRPAARWAWLAMFAGIVIVGLLWLDADADWYLFESFRAQDIHRVFLPLLWLDVTALLMTVVGGGCALVLTLRRLRERSFRGVLLGLLALACAGFLPRAYPHLMSLRRFNFLPVVDIKGPPVFHLGKTRQVEYRMALRPGFVSAPDGEKWHIRTPPTTVTSPAPRRFSLSARADNGLVYIESNFELAAVREVAGPLLPLRVDNRWEYQVTGECRYKSANRADLKHTLSIRILAPKEEYGLRMFGANITAQEADERPSHFMFAADGETYVIGSDGLMVPFAAPLPGGRCALGLFEVQGTCRSGPADASFALPGPESWSEKKQMSEGGTFFFGLLTLGLYTPEPYVCTYDFKLLRSNVGPADAAHAD